MTSPSLTNPLDQSAKSDWLARHLDLVGVILVALNPDGTITYINQRAVKLLGCEHLDVPGSNWFDLLCPSASASRGGLISGGGCEASPARASGLSRRW